MCSVCYRLENSYYDKMASISLAPVAALRAAFHTVQGNSAMPVHTCQQGILILLSKQSYRGELTCSHTSSSEYMQPLSQMLVSFHLGMQILDRQANCSKGISSQADKKKTKMSPKVHFRSMYITGSSATNGDAFPYHSSALSLAIQFFIMNTIIIRQQLA